MKKTLIALLSILLIAFAFTACDNGNKGPGITEEDQKAADELAKEYMNSLNLGELIVQAFNDENTSTLKLENENKDGFRIEFTNYKGSALKPVKDSEIASIASGAIDFTFSKTTATATTSSKATVADYNTYTATTVDEKPLKFMKADGETAVGGDFAFAITGKATISFETTSTGVIEGLTEGSNISIQKPETATNLSVGTVPVSYDTIKGDVSNNNGSAQVKDPFTQDEAQTALASIINSISKEKLAADVNKGLSSVMGTPDSGVVGVKFDGLSGTYQNKTLNEAAVKELLQILANPESSQTPTDGTVKEIAQAAQSGTLNILDLSLTLKAHFEAEGNNGYYTSGLHEGTATTGAESSVKSINGGSVEMTIYPSTGNLGNSSLSGIYTLSVKNVVFAMKDSAADDQYTVSFENLKGTFSLGNDGNDASLPAENDSTLNITISNGVDSPSVKWADIVSKLDKGTGFAKTEEIQNDAKAFYQHFGTKKFLIALNEAFDKPSKEISIGTESIAITDNSFTLPVTFTNYQYHTKFGNQLVSGTVNFTFKGTVEGERGNQTFKATSFAVSTEKDKVLNLSDNAGLRPDATVSFNNNEGTIGNGGNANGNVVFEVGGDTEKTITGITDYSGDGAYTKANEFVLKEGITSVEIKF